MQKVTTCTVPVTTTALWRTLLSQRSAFVVTLVAVFSLAGCSPGRPSWARDALDTDAALDVAVDTAPSCRASETACGGRCVDTSSDPNHCGTCGRECPGYQACVDGTCVTRCPEGQTLCGSQCATLETDRAHCGACGRACGPGEVCSAGRCAATCATGYLSCTLPTRGDAGVGTDAGAPQHYCVDPMTDRYNCGGCGNVCVSGSVCQDGRCGYACAPGETRCGSRCYDLQSDRANCGACGNACPGTQVCTMGTCASACVAGQTDCMGACVNLMTSRAHCGMCGHACAPGEVCTGGVCVLSCATGQTACGGRCTDLQTDVLNCGACGTACGAGEACVMGVCRLTCAMGSTACGDRCVDLSSDRTNCGACGIPCGPGQLCVGGACRMSCGAGQTLCAGLCVDTNVDTANCGGCGVACAAGYGCVSGVCRPLVGTDAGACDAPSRMCGGVCVDPRNDNNHCGTCGNACSADRTCVMGMCVAPCAAGEVRCGTSCTRTSSDRNNCGACGNVCAAGLSCVSGTCTMEPTFQIGTLSTTGCTNVDHSAPSGDDRGGIALSATRVFYTGDTATVSLNADDLTGVMSIGTQHDGMISDLATSTVYVLLDAMGNEPRGASVSSFTATQLGVLDGTTGALTSTRIPLSRSITMGGSTQASIFSGYGRMIVHTGGGTGVTPEWFQILPSGTVTSLGTAAGPTGATACENWARWGIAEFFGGEHYVVYVRNSGEIGIARQRVRDAMTSMIATVSNVGDVCSITFSPSRNRWYYHYESTPSWGATFGEVVGYCAGTFTTP